MSITTILQTQIVDSVGSVVQTDIVQDSVTHLWTREIRVYGTPNSSDDEPLLYTLRITGTNKEYLELTAPSVKF